MRGEILLLVLFVVSVKGAEIVSLKVLVKPTNSLLTLVLRLAQNPVLGIRAESGIVSHCVTKTVPRTLVVVAPFATPQTPSATWTA